MSRIRTIKPEFAASKSVGRLSRDARLYFLQLLTETDDEGRIVYLPKKLSGILYPHDDDVSGTEIEAWTLECEAQGMLLRYEADGGMYLLVTGFSKHQNVNRPTPSRLPDPPGMSTHGALSEDSVRLQEFLGAGNRKEEIGNRRESVCAQSAPAPPRPEKVREVTTRMSRPTAEAVAAFFKESLSTGHEARKFFDHYTANGWKVGRNPMRDWQAAARNWISRDRASPGTSGSSGFDDVVSAGQLEVAH